MMLRMSRPTIVLFGDSITQQGFAFSDGNSPGWAGLLANAYTRRADVLNRGFSGYNSRHAMDILPSVFGSSSDSSLVGRPLFVTVFFGANDASLPGDREHCQHVPVDEYEGNLRKIVQAIRDRFQGNAATDKPPIILMTPPPVYQPKWDKFCMEKFDELSPRTNEVSKLYGDRVKSIAKDLGCSVVDSFSVLEGNEKEETYEKYLEDGLHLNGLGNKALFEGFMNVLNSDFPQLAPMKDGDGKNGETGIPLEGSLWTDLC
mmetsp:Transcript_117/g.221  ORF Transcript_117/g.221 Transcript_117/m.221 type:complete len:260 (-) Transcript_117:84-863(-)